MKPLTLRQAEILGVIQSFLEKHHTAPTYREIAEAVGIKGLRAVETHLDALESKGYVERAELGRRVRRVLRDADGRRVRLRFVEVGDG